MADVNRITFNGIDLREYGLYVSGNKAFSSAEKKFTKVSIPQRNGDLILPENRFSNVNVTYEAIQIKDFKKNSAKLREILLAPDGYVRLEDSYNPDEYRMAVFKGPLNFDAIYLSAGRANLTFDSMPQRFLKSGEIPTTLSDPGAPIFITNNSPFDSIPTFAISPQLMPLHFNPFRLYLYINNDEYIINFKSIWQLAFYSPLYIDLQNISLYTEMEYTSILWPDTPFKVRNYYKNYELFKYQSVPKLMAGMQNNIMYDIDADSNIEKYKYKVEVIPNWWTV